MIPNVENSNVSRQEFIDLLCRITKSDEEMTTNIESEITIIDDNSTVEEGEIITIDDDDENDEKKEIEDGEITESEGSDVCIN
jgi:hypothetical protein